MGAHVPRNLIASRKCLASALKVKLGELLE